MSTLLAIFTSVAGCLILFLAVAVMHSMDLRQGRIFAAVGWVLVAAAGTWLGLGPLIDPGMPFWALTVVASALAVIGWRNVDALIEQACTPGHLSGNWPAGLVFAAAASAATVAPGLVDRPKVEIPIRLSDPHAQEKRVTETAN